ncbi:MAG: hypothetical protein P1U40_14390 [Coxiellaceae bacterium]|nr:hypothetical protein [Coxiellaceae bacterium]
MSRIKFRQLEGRVPARVVPVEQVMADYAAHRAMLKIIWSGHGGSRHANARVTDGRWDMSDWDYLIDQFKAPETNRPVYGEHHYGHGYHQSSVGDDPRDRSQWYSHHAKSWQSRTVTGVRGRAKPGYQRIKAGHYTLLPPHGKMEYCRGLDPQTGRLARSGSRHFEHRSFSYPGLQVGWVFSADPANGSEVKHCSQTDMYGRRVPWVGGASAVRAAMRGTHHASTGAPELITADELRRRQATAPADGSLLKHSDCRFKPTLASASAILVPGAAAEGTLGLFNAIQKKLYLLTELNTNVSIIDKAPSDAMPRPVALAEQWQALCRASVEYPALFEKLPTDLMQIDATVLPELVTIMMGATAQEKQKQALQFVLSQYGLHADVKHELDDPCLLKDMLRLSDNRDAMYALLQCGACITDTEVLTHLMANWREYRQVLDEATQRRIVDYIVQQQLTHDLVYSGETDLVKQLRTVTDLPEWPMALREAVELECSANRVDLLRLLSGQVKRDDAELGFSDAARERVEMQAFAMAVVTLNNDWQQECIDARQWRDSSDANTVFLALVKDALVNIKKLRMPTATQQLFLQALQSQIVERGIELHDCQFILFMPAIYRKLSDDLRYGIMDSLFASDAVPHPVDELNADQRVALLDSLVPGGAPGYVAAVLMHPNFPLQTADEDTCKRVTRFLLSRGFDSLTAQMRANLMAHFSLAFELYAPVENKYDFDAYCHRVVANNVSALELFPWGSLAMQDQQVFAVARALDASTMQHYSLVIKHFHRKVSELNSFLHPRETKAIAPLATLVAVLQSLPHHSAYAGQPMIVLPADKYKQLVAAIRSCRACRLSDEIKTALNLLVKILRATVQANAVVQHSHTDGEPLARLPHKAFDVSMASRQQNIHWRRRGYDYFRAAYATTDGYPEQTTVKVYSCDDLTKGSLLMGLDRASGYAMNNKQRSDTKKRVICSTAQLFQDEHTILPISVVTVAAPNLRKSTGAGAVLLASVGGGYDSPYDGAAFVKGESLNEPAYFRAMLSGWALSFHALNQQARSNRKSSIVVTPLLGGGAFLAGQPIEVKHAAFKQNILAMITAYNAQPQPYLPELHLCLPKMDAGDRNSAFAYIQSILPELPKLNGRLVISQSDLFELTFQTYASEGFDSDSMDVAIVNPASDHVPGGGCYNERHAGFDSVGRNQPAVFNSGPMALEEQLAHVTTLMYSQCASMNPDHLRFSAINAVKVSEDGSTEQAAGDTLEQQAKAKGLTEDYSVAKYLASKLRRLYPFAPVAPSASLQPPHFSARSPAVVHRAPPPPPRAPSIQARTTRPAVVSQAVSAQPASSHAAKYAVITPSEYLRKISRLVAVISKAQPRFSKLLHGDKFKKVSGKLQTEQGGSGVPYRDVSRYLALILLTAVSSRDGKLETSHTNSGEAAVNALNTSFPIFATMVRDQLGAVESQPLTYGDIQTYAMTTETFRRRR